MEEQQENKKIEINHYILRNLNTIRKWTMFLSITGFISLGVVIIFGILTGTFLSVFSSEEAGAGIREMAVVLGVLGIMLIYMFPVLFLFSFSKHAAKAAHHEDQVELNKAFKSLKYFFGSLGIFTIILLAVYIASLIFAGTSMTLLN
jgi:mannose/fructose/N-acetylgalactosamine-specific phosphotransferase system component IIC